MSKIKVLLLQIVFGIVLLEILLRCLYFQRIGNDTFAVVSAYKSVAFRTSDNYKERLLKNHNLIRPDSAAVNEMIVDEVIASNAFEYAPWADFKLKDFAGTYVNSSGYLRRSVPDRVLKEGTDTVKVFLFGGSTMFGFDVIDKETIPSQLAGIIEGKCDSCKSVEVYNYGVLSYYSYNELMLFHHLLSTGQRPDVVVFLDGLNDLFIIQAARKRVPWYYFRLKENIQDARDSTRSLFDLSDGQTYESVANEAINNYFQNAAHIKKLCAAYNVQPYFFIQPNPFYNYPRQRNDPVTDHKRNMIIEYGYPVIKSRCDSADRIFFLGDMLQNDTHPPFIDEVHYSPYMNRKLAEEIFGFIRQDLSEVRGERK